MSDDKTSAAAAPRKDKQGYSSGLLGQPVPAQAARPFGLAGLITGGEEDHMVIHTKEAAKLFNGSAGTKDGGIFIPGARMGASNIRRIFVCAWRDNPYADQALVIFEDKAAEIAKAIAAEERGVKALLDERAKRGMSWQLLQSKNPAKIALGFRSPYGYSICNLICDFDHMVLMFKTAEYRDLIASSQMRRSIQRIKTMFRRLFVFTYRASSLLLHEGVVGICRGDWFPDMPTTSVKRIETAKAVFAKLFVLSDDVLKLKREPRHSSRSYIAPEKEKQVFLYALEVAEQKQNEASQVAETVVQVNTDRLM